MPYQDWTAQLKQIQMQIGGPLQEYTDFDMMCIMYSRYEKGLGLEIDGSQGVNDMSKEDQRAFPPVGPDERFYHSPKPLRKDWLALISGKRTRLRHQRTRH